MKLGACAYRPRRRVVFAADLFRVLCLLISWSPVGFWLAHTLDQLATAQGVPEVSDVDSIRGIWPQDDLSDGFDVALRQWRSQDAEHHQ